LFAFVLTVHAAAQQTRSNSSTQSERATSTALQEEVAKLLENAAQFLQAGNLTPPNRSFVKR
jgi:hypothetical protein